MRSYVLDTDTCIYILKNKPESALKKFIEHKNDLLAISVITYAELIYGVEKSSSKKVNQSVVEDFVSRLIVYPFNDLAANEYGKLRAYLENKGSPIGSMDMLIAAHVISLDSILVTNNHRHFFKVPKLKLENWVETSMSSI